MNDEDMITKSPEPMKKKDVEDEPNLAELFAKLGPDGFIQLLTASLAAKLKQDKTEERPRPPKSSRFKISGIPEPRTIRLRFDVELDFQVDEPFENAEELSRAAKEHFSELMVGPARDLWQTPEKYKGPHGIWVSGVKVNEPAEEQEVEKLRKALEDMFPDWMAKIGHTVTPAELAIQLLGMYRAKSPAEGLDYSRDQLKRLAFYVYSTWPALNVKAGPEAIVDDAIQLLGILGMYQDKEVNKPSPAEDLSEAMRKLTRYMKKYGVEVTIGLKDIDR